MSRIEEMPEAKRAAAADVERREGYGDGDHQAGLGGAGEGV